MYDVGDTVSSEDWSGTIIGYASLGGTEAYCIERDDGDGYELLPCCWLDDVGVAH